MRFSRLGTATALAAVCLVAAGCAEADRRDEVRTFCAAFDAYNVVEEDGTVGEFGPALATYADSVPKAALTRVKDTVTDMSSSWNELYKNYVDSGGDPTVRLQVKNEIPAEIAGMHAEWTDGLIKADIKSLYAYSNKTCQLITPASTPSS